MGDRAKRAATGPSQRQLKVGELIRHAITEIFARGDLHDDVLARHSLTVPEVRRLLWLLLAPKLADLHRLHWSRWRRKRQEAARRSHYRRRVAS